MQTTLQKQSLYNIQQDHLNLLAAIEDNDGLLEPWMEQQLALTEEAIQAKGLSYGFVIKKYLNESEIIDNEIKRLKDLKNKSDRMAEVIKARLTEGMQQFGIEKIECPTLKLSFRKSEAVEIDNVYAVPKEYYVAKDPEISKSKIKEALKEGVSVPGASLVSKMNLQIK